MNSLLLSQFIACLVIVVLAFLRWAPKIVDSLIQRCSGEQGTLMPRGFMSHSARIRRAIELQAVLSRLALITRLNLPFCAALEAAAQGERRKVRETLREISRRIRSGEPLSGALAGAFRGCPPPMIASLQRAESHGQLTRALDQQEQMTSSMIDVHFGSTAHLRHAVGYALVMMLICVVIVSWVMVFLIPNFKEIFLDFDTRLPAITMTLINLSDWIAMLVPGFFVMLGVVLVVLILLLSGGKRINGMTNMGRFVAWVRWSLPITRTLDYGLGMARAIRSMELAVRSGAPSAFADSQSKVLGTTNHVRPRLDIFSRSISQGVAPHRAARDAQLGDVFVCALRMVERGDDPGIALSHAANYYEAIAYRWWHALAALSGPLVTLAMGVMVGFVALALFAPLIALIDAVSGTLR